jgi:adenylate cyclase
MKSLARHARRLLSARILGAGLLLAFLALRWWDPGPLEELRLRTFDLFQVISPRVAAQRPVVIVDIDEESLRKLGQWPWPRTRVAELIDRLTQAGAAAIAFDVIFAEPDRLSPALAADVYRTLDDETRAKLRALPSNDQIMADALRRSRVVLGESTLPVPVPRPEGQPPPVGVASFGSDPKPFLFSFPGLLRNIDTLDNAAAGRGLFSILPERDGIVRRVPMVMLAQDTIVPSLSLEVIRVVTRTNTIMTRADTAGIRSVAVPEARLEFPTDRNGRFWLHFSLHDPARFVSAVDVLEGRVPADRVAQRLILIGTSAIGLLDQKTTPVDPAMPGVEVHAQILESILTNATLSAPNYAVVVELGAALVLGVVIIVLAPILSPALLLLFGAAIVSALIGTSWYYFTQQKLLLISPSRCCRAC